MDTANMTPCWSCVHVRYVLDAPLCCALSGRPAVGRCAEYEREPGAD